MLLLPLPFRVISPNSSYRRYKRKLTALVVLFAELQIRLSLLACNTNAAYCYIFAFYFVVADSCRVCFLFLRNGICVHTVDVRWRPLCSFCWEVSVICSLCHLFTDRKRPNDRNKDRLVYSLLLLRSFYWFVFYFLPPVNASSPMTNIAR